VALATIAAAVIGHVVTTSPVTYLSRPLALPGGGEMVAFEELSGPGSGDVLRLRLYTTGPARRAPRVELSPLSFAGIGERPLDIHRKSLSTAGLTAVDVDVRVAEWQREHEGAFGFRVRGTAPTFGFVQLAGA
jgi:hypothetical protein